MNQKIAKLQTTFKEYVIIYEKKVKLRDCGDLLRISIDGVEKLIVKKRDFLLFSID